MATSILKGREAVLYSTVHTVLYSTWDVSTMDEGMIKIHCICCCCFLKQFIMQICIAAFLIVSTGGTTWKSSMELPDFLNLNRLYSFKMTSLCIQPCTFYSLHLQSCIPVFQSWAHRSLKLFNRSSLLSGP